MSYLGTGFLALGLLVGLRAQVLPEIKAAGYGVPLRPRFAPGQVLTLFAPGVNVPATPITNNADTLPLPTTLADITVAAVETSRAGGFRGNLPIFGVTNVLYFGGVSAEGPNLAAITVQMPAIEFCPAEAGPNPCWYVPILSVTVMQAGIAVARSEMVAVGTSPHVLNSCDSSVSPFLSDAVKIGQLMAQCAPIIAHPNGTIVSGENPARLGETVSIYATGLGWGITSALVGTPAPKEGVPLDASSITVAFDFNPTIDPFPTGLPPEGKPAYAGLTGGLVGTYQINVRLPRARPATARTCGGFADTNLGINLGFAGTGDVTFVRLCVKF